LFLWYTAVIELGSIKRREGAGQNSAECEAVTAGDSQLNVLSDITGSIEPLFVILM
jgi:hypothetical protein